MSKLLQLLKASTLCPPDARGDDTIELAAASAVDQILCLVRDLIAQDQEGLFMYKRPRLDEVRYSMPSRTNANSLTAAPSAFSAISTMTAYVGTMDTTANWIPMSQAADKAEAGSPLRDWSDSESDSDTYSSSDSDSDRSRNTVRSDDHYRRHLFEQIDWPTIGEFVLWQAVQQIREYIILWRLTPATQFELITPQAEGVAVPPFGRFYEVEAHFSKPTITCPNPLPVSKIYFKVSVSDLIPDIFPVMVTYRFEGFRTLFYALGSRCVRSLRFQRFYIDTTLQAKMDFFAEIGERHQLQPVSSQARRTMAARETVFKSLMFAGITGGAGGGEGDFYDTDGDVSYNQWLQDKAARRNHDVAENVN